MANPQPDKFLRISIELFDVITTTYFTSHARMVFDHIIRMTYGFNRKSFETTHHQIAAKLGIHRQRVSEALKWLEERKIVNSTHSRAVLSRNCITSLSIQKDYEKWTNGTQNRAVERRNNFELLNKKYVEETLERHTEPCRLTNGTQNRAVNGTATCAAIIKKTKDNKSTTKIGKKKINTCKPHIYTPPTGEQLKENGSSWINPGAWNDFVQHRREIKKPLTELATKKSIEFLSKYKNRQREIIDISIRSRWQGLFPPKGNQQNSTAEVVYNDPKADEEKFYGKQ